MEDKEFLNEEQYQKTNKKVNVLGTILMIFGILSFITCSVLIFGGFLEIRTMGAVGFIWVFSFAMFGIGLGLFTSAHRRQIMSYHVQQIRPIAEEGMEKMAPTVGKAGATIAKEMAPAYKEIAKEMAPAYGDIAKEVSKGIKEGLHDGDAGIYCKHCGAKIDADSKFCKSCGKQL